MLKEGNFRKYCNKQETVRFLEKECKTNKDWEEQGNLSKKLAKQDFEHEEDLNNNLQRTQQRRKATSRKRMESMGTREFAQAEENLRLG